MKRNKIIIGFVLYSMLLYYRMASIVKEEEPEAPEPQLAAPEVIISLEDAHIEEGDSAKFMVKITGYPRPRVNWFVNKTLCVNVNCLNSIN
jgi:hypothetical protein